MDQKASAALVDHQVSDILSPSSLEQIHVIARHGARSLLSKDADTLAKAAGGTLTPLGQKQLFQLGTWLKDTYGMILGRPTNTGEKSLSYYNPNLHRFESSNRDTTLSSANAVAMGLFPSKSRASASKNIDPSEPSYHDSVLYETSLDVPPAIPVYTSGKEENDITLRAHKQCPTFNNRLAQLYKRPEWKKMEEDQNDLLAKLATFYPSMAENGIVPLTEVWNVYEAIHVAKTECLDSNTSSDACRAFLTRESVVAANMLMPTEFQQLETLAEHIEFLKYGAGLDTPKDTGHITAGTLLGSNLLRKILNRSEGDGHLFYYSAHAPTVLGFLATLQAGEDFYRDTQGEKFIEYGSALIVEIHKSRDKGIKYFVLKYKSSDSSQASHIVMKQSTTGVQCNSDDSGLDNIPKASWCLLDEVTAFAKTYALTSDDDWCKACKNESSDVCIRRNNSRGTPKLDAWLASSESMGYAASTGSTTIICALFFGGFLTGVALMGVLWCCRERTTITIAKNSGKSAIGLTEDASTRSYASDDGKDSPIVIETIDMEMDMNNSAEKLNNKEIC